MIKIVFFGTPIFAAKTLESLIDHGLEVLAVVTQPDKPKGRSGRLVPPPVKAVAEDKLPGVPIFQPERASSPEFLQTLARYSADIFVVVAYGQILKQELLDIPRLGCVNVHASLLPKYRGAAPIQRALIDGERETGVTIMHMVKKLDAGPMIKQAKVKIGPNMTAGELHDLLQTVGAETLIKALHEIAMGTAPSIPQEDSLATYAPKIEPEDCEIHWENPARELFNLIRGVSPFPGAWCRVKVRGEAKRLKILSARVVQGYTSIPGQILSYGEEGVIIACGDEALRVLELKLEGKRGMNAEEFTRGIPESEIQFLS